MTGSNTIYMPKDVRRDPRTGEAATDPTTSRADDPTHGVDPIADRVPFKPTQGAADRTGNAAGGAMQNAESKRSSGGAITGFVLAVLVLIALGIIVWLMGA